MSPRRKANKNQLPMQSFFPRFGAGFLSDHAGLIMNDPKIAIVELVANSWDAGADQVHVMWPDSSPGTLAVEDNGVGMTYDQFTQRWVELSYSRKQVQGDDVEFPSDNRKSSRKAFGRNGKGRHSMFCFADEYAVETWRDGIFNRFVVRREQSGTAPFVIQHEAKSSKQGHGTIVSAELTYHHVPVGEVRDLIGSKFIADPSLEIYVNKEIVELTDLGHYDTDHITVEGVGDISIHRIDSQKTGRTSRQHGIAWWVNRRLVGEPAWRGFDDDAYLDARTVEAKRYTFVVEADVLADQVSDDWSRFRSSSKVERAHQAVKERVLKMLREVMAEAHRSRKRAALEEHRQDLRELPTASRHQISQFIDEIQVRCPTITQRDLSATVGVLSSLEASRSGYKLIEQLAQLDPDDLDALTELLQRWTVHEAQIVLDELERRLRLIANMGRLLESPSADELHEIQPLFERGLWIFGPEYESISFASNRTLATIVREFLDGDVVHLSTPRRRPDFVVLPDASVGVYSCDSFDERGEVDGIGKVLIVELKRGGFQIGRKERQQGLDYANELRKSGKLSRSTNIVVFVLGTLVSTDAQDTIAEGDNTKVYPRTYSTIINMANARTFKLHQRLQLAGKEYFADPLVDHVLSMPEQSLLFEEDRHAF